MNHEEQQDHGCDDQNEKGSDSVPRIVDFNALGFLFALLTVNEILLTLPQSRV